MDSNVIKDHLLEYLNKIYPHSEAIKSLSERFSIEKAVLDQLFEELISEGMPIIQNNEVVSLLYPILSKESIQQQLITKSLGKSILLFQSLSSTNDYLKKHLSASPNGMLVLAHKQSLGKGRLGREWSSPAGKAISMSLLLKPKQTNLNYSILTQAAAAALVKALSPYVNAEIKWPNDVLVNKKKVAGILTEAEFSGNHLEGVIIGIGVNTNMDAMDISPDIKEKATSLKVVSGPVDPNLIVANFLKYFEDFYKNWLIGQNAIPFLDVCRSHSALIGKDYWIETNIGTDQIRRKAKIKTIDDSGSLVVTYLDTLETTTLISTHYSIRSDTGYV